MVNAATDISTKIQLNKGKIVGQKALLKLKAIWAIRIRLQLGTRELCGGQVISDSSIDFLAVDSRSKALGDRLPSFECSLMLL